MSQGGGRGHLFTEEDFNDNQDVDETPKEEITVDFGEAAESMLDDIKSDSLYGVSASAEADDFDPGELSSDAVINVDDVVVERGESERLAESTDLDEPPSPSPSIRRRQSNTSRMTMTRRLPPNVRLVAGGACATCSSSSSSSCSSSSPSSACSSGATVRLPMSSSRIPTCCRLPRPVQTPRSSRRSMPTASPTSSATSA